MTEITKKESKTVQEGNTKVVDRGESTAKLLAVNRLLLADCSNRMINSTEGRNTTGGQKVLGQWKMRARKQGQGTELGEEPVKDDGKEHVGKMSSQGLMGTSELRRKGMLRKKGEWRSS